MATKLQEAGDARGRGPVPAHRAPARAVLHAQAVGLHRARPRLHRGLPGDRGRAGRHPQGQGPEAHLRDQDHPHPGRRADRGQRRAQAAHRRPRAGDVELLVRQGARHAERPPAGPVPRRRGAEGALPRAGLPLLEGQDGHRALAEARAGRHAGARLRDRASSTSRSRPSRARARSPSATARSCCPRAGAGCAAGRRSGWRRSTWPTRPATRSATSSRPSSSAARRWASWRGGTRRRRGSWRRRRRRSAPPSSSGSRRPASGSPRSRRAPSTRRCSSSGSRR